MREVPDQTLREFARGNAAYELIVPYLEETLWFVPSIEVAGQFVREGVNRGRIWTAAELLDLARIPSLPRPDLERIVRLKAVFGADIVDVTPDVDGRTGGDYVAI